MMRTSSPYTKSNPNKARILVVDDDSDITTFFKLALVDAGFNVDVYNDPLQVISNFKPNYYDLLLIDIRMPRLNGFELLKKLRKKDTRVKVCFITSFEVYYEAMIAEHPSIKNSISGFIRTPITLENLIERIQNIDIRNGKLEFKWIYTLSMLSVVLIFGSLMDAII
jgi:DNA-binding response OmpR family regulator